VSFLCTYLMDLYLDFRVRIKSRSGEEAEERFVIGRREFTRFMDHVLSIF
jgi:hypothetical protein